MEIQVNGGSVIEKVDFARSLLEKEISANSVFSQDEMIDIIGATKGKGFRGNIKFFDPYYDHTLLVDTLSLL